MNLESNYNNRASAAIESQHLGGKIAKMYGKDGEVVLRLYGDISPAELATKIKNEPIWVEIDSIGTPFFVTSIKGQGMSGAVVTLQDIDTERLAEILLGRNFYVESLVVRRERADDWAMLEGCKFIDITSNIEGSIKTVIDNSLNPLLEVVTRDGREFFVPIAEELIVGFNKRKKMLEMELVDGFFDN